MQYFIAMMLSVMLLTSCRGGISTSTPVTDEASLIKELETRGARVITGVSYQQSFLSVPSKFYTIDDAEIQVSEYPSAEAMEVEAAKFSPDGRKIGSMIIDYFIAPPHYYKSGRIIVFYQGDDSDVMLLLTQILGRQFAGA